MMTALPRVTPLVLKRRPEAFDNDAWLFDLKYDGFRALLEIDGSGACLISRNRNRFKHLDTLAAALAKRLRVHDAILDGEIICADETGRPIFIDLLRRKEPCFVAFDLLWLNGEDLRALPLVERKARLRRLLRRRSNHLIAEALSVDGRGKALMAAVEQHDLEGIVAKRKSDPYRRGVSWWKIKNRAYSQADDGRGELLNGDRRAIIATAKRAKGGGGRTMEMIVLDTLGKLRQYGHSMFGWCRECGSPSRYWDDVKARRAPKPAMFDIDLVALMRERGRDCRVVGLEPVASPGAGQQRQRRALRRRDEPCRSRVMVSVSSAFSPQLTSARFCCFQGGHLGARHHD